MHFIQVRILRQVFLSMFVSKSTQESCDFAQVTFYIIIDMNELMSEKNECHSTNDTKTSNFIIKLPGVAL